MLPDGHALVGSEVLGEASRRRVYLADSFKGIPPVPPDGRKYTRQDQKGKLIGILNDNDVRWVQRDARRLDGLRRGRGRRREAVASRLAQ